MGKRELLIIVIFGAVAFLAYQLTAPASPEGRGFSFSRLFREMHREVRGNPATAGHTHRGTMAVSAELEEIRISAGMARVRVVGEARKDIAYDLPIESTGPDQATALEYAKRVNVRLDDLGATATLSVVYPKEGSQSGVLTVLVPSRLAVRMVGGVPAIENVASVQLEAVSGDTTIKNVAGALTGVHQNGRLAADAIGSITLAIQRSRAHLSNVRGDVTLTARSGECSIEDTRGHLIIEPTGVELSIARHQGPVRVTGSGGIVRLDGTGGDVSIDMRRAEVEVIVTGAHPMTLLTTDEPLRLFLDEDTGLAMDAMASEGKIQASEFGLAPETHDRDMRLTHTFGTGKAPRAALRNTRGDIVIRLRK
jgi:hypothetical protein